MYGLGCLLRRPPLDTGGTRSFEAAGCDGRDTVVIVAADHQIPVMPTAEPVNRVILHCRQQSKKQHWRCSSIQDQSIQHHLGKICNSLAAFWVIPCLLLLLVSRKWHWKTRWDFWLIVFVDDKLLNSSIISGVWIEDTFELSHWQMCLWSSPFSLLFLRSTTLLQALSIPTVCCSFTIERPFPSLVPSLMRPSQKKFPSVLAIIEVESRLEKSWWRILVKQLLFQRSLAQRRKCAGRNKRGSGEATFALVNTYERFYIN